jgi:ABC-2 type transport system ATP-binding protein
MDAVTIDRASKRFGDDFALTDVTISVREGTILGIIGPSGAGKTTLVRLMTGALAPTEGEIRVMGEDPLRFKRRTRERVGYMPQSFALYPDLTTRENVDFVASLFGLLWWRRRRRTRQVLETVDLWSVRDRRAGKLSGGMQRRLELASALVHDPAILFLDEPTAGIDPLLRTTIWEELSRLRDDGRTLLVTTQYVGEAERCDAVLLISDGRVIAAGTPDELRRTAIGGDIVEVETAGRHRHVRLPTGRGRRPASSSEGPNQVRITVSDAATMLPEIVEAITRCRRRGGDRRRGPTVVRRGLRDPRRTVACLPAEAGKRRGASRLMRAILTVIWRLLAFVGKELVETLRRPGAILSLILGPFLIMAIFGAGFNGIRRELETIVVVPTSDQLPTEASDYQELAGPALHIADVVQDRAEAEARLRAGEVDVVVVAPEDPEGAFRAGKRSTIEIVVDEVDPVPRTTRRSWARRWPTPVNQRIIERAVEEGEGYALAAARGAGIGDPRRRGLRTDRSTAGEPGATGADGDLVLRPGRARADPPAPGRDPRLDVAGPGTVERRDGTVPDLPGHRIGGA